MDTSGYFLWKLQLDNEFYLATLNVQAEVWASCRSISSQSLSLSPPISLDTNTCGFNADMDGIIFCKQVLPAGDIILPATSLEASAPGAGRRIVVYVEEVLWRPLQTYGSGSEEQQTGAHPQP